MRLRATRGSLSRLYGSSGEHATLVEQDLSGVRWGRKPGLVLTALSWLQASPKRPVERDTSVSGMYLFPAIIARFGLTASRSKGSSFRAAVTTKVMKLSRRKQLVAPKFGNYPQAYL